MLKLENIYNSNNSSSNGNNSSNSNNTIILKFIHRCLLYLGDLLRYQELYADNKEKNYNEAESYYRRAAYLMPSYGNPHNQLAALSSYMDISCVAIYHSCRSLLVKNPFDTAIENIKVFFEKNSRLFSQLDRDQIQISRNDNDKSKKSAKTKQFFVMFLRLHGVLFEWTQSTLEVLSKDNIDISNTQAAPFKFKKFIDLMDEVIEDYDSLLNTSCFGEQILIKILIICIFSLHRGAEVSKTIRDKLYGNEREYKTSRSIPESLALTIIFTLVNKTAARIHTVSKSNDKSNDRDKSRRPPSAILKSLPLVSVFAEWAGVYSQYLIGIEPINHADLTCLEKSLVADTDILQRENRSRSGMRLSMVSLDEFTSSNQKNSSLKKDIYNKPLREHVELRGFLPLDKLYENYFSHMDPLSKIPNPLADEFALECRLRTIHMFLHHSLIPAGTQEVTDNSNKRKSANITQNSGLHRGGLLPISTAAINAVMKDKSKSPKNKNENGRKKKSKDKYEANSKRRASSALNDPDYDRTYPTNADSNVDTLYNLDHEDDDYNNDEEDDNEDADDGADMSLQVADILMVQPQRSPPVQGDTLFFSNLGLLGSHSNENFSVGLHNQITTQEIHNSHVNTEGYEDDLDDVVVFKPAFSRNDFSSNSPSIPMDAEPYLPFANKQYHNFKSNGSLQDKWDVKADEPLDYNWWGNEATEYLNAGILDDNDVKMPVTALPPPPGLGFN